MVKSRVLCKKSVAGLPVASLLRHPDGAIFEIKVSHVEKDHFTAHRRCPDRIGSRVEICKNKVPEGTAGPELVVVSLEKALLVHLINQDNVFQDCKTALAAAGGIARNTFLAV
jgi:hypothetical protein